MPFEEETPPADRTRGEAMGVRPNLNPRRDRQRPDREASGSGADDRPEPRPLGRAAKRELAVAEEALEAARAEATEATDKYLRIAAEMENMRRRHRQDQADRLQYGNAELITRLLPVLDNFHRALDHATEGESGAGTDQLVSGLLMVVKQFEDILEAEGVSQIEAVGKPFDPNLHQAVMAEPSDEQPDDHVVAELQRGYMLHERVLRPSMVKVARSN